jgi:hypothetical protein
MSENLKLEIRCTHLSMVHEIVSDSVNLLWIHLVDLERIGSVEALVRGAELDANLRCVMVSGNMCEHVHDVFDDVLEEKWGEANDVLTIWCEDGFSEAAWEFLNVYAARDDVRSAKALFVAESLAAQMGLLSELSAITLDHQ